MTTLAKKWLYAFVESDSIWLKPAADVVYGAKKAQIRFDIDSSLLEAGREHEGGLQLTANGGQLFRLKVVVEVRRKNEPFTRRLLRPFFKG